MENYQNQDFSCIRDTMQKYFDHLPERNITIYTGVGGADLFEESMEERFGLERVYAGKKPLRILSKIVKYRKSHSGRLFIRRKVREPQLL